MNEQKLSISVLQPFPEERKAEVDDLLKKEADQSCRKIVVLDDDPTGVQTVHDVSVYTDWSVQSIQEGFREDNKLFFILTNSRGLTQAQTTKAHQEIADRVDEVSQQMGIDYLIYSRSDSTLRGHFPLETEVLRAGFEKHHPNEKVDGEILAPYFNEGGRFTVNNVHYVRYGEELVPVGQTEFAQDDTFGFHSSNLGEYVEEKTKGAYRKENVTFIEQADLRAMAIDKVVTQLDAVQHFNKVVVNATDDYDMKVFAVALYRSLNHGKRFIVRGAAALLKALGNISTIPLLKRQQMINDDSLNGGIIVVGSHTNKTTAQLNELKKVPGIEFIEMNSDLVLVSGALEKEVERILKLEDDYIAQGITVCVSTKRALLKVDHDTPEAALERSVQISAALQKCVGYLKTKPSFVVAKGGITSSDVGIKALRVKKANVLGQIEPGVPVWRTGEESTFPNIAYVIFPGNVGEVATLRNAVEKLLGNK